jgi:hypothetical protein
MAKRKLASSTQQIQQREKREVASRLDAADRALGEPTPGSTEPVREATKIPRSTDRLSISLLSEERDAVEGLSAALRAQGHRDLKTSRLVRVAIKMLLDAPNKEILRVAEEVPNLEKLRGRRS